MEFLQLPLRKAKFAPVTQAPEVGSLVSGAPLSFGRINLVGLSCSGLMLHQEAVSFGLPSRGVGGGRAEGEGLWTCRNLFQPALGQALDPR